VTSSPKRRISLVIDASPAYLLQAGLPYTYADMAIILDENPTDVPERYRETDNARKLLSIVTDGVRTDGVVICPAKAWELQDYAREQDLRVAIFRTDEDVTRRDQRVAMAVGRVRDGEIWLERCGDPRSAGTLRDDIPAEAQVAAALAEYVLSNACSD